MGVPHPRPSPNDLLTAGERCEGRREADDVQPSRHERRRADQLNEVTVDEDRLPHDEPAFDVAALFPANTGHRCRPFGALRAAVTAVRIVRCGGAHRAGAFDESMPTRRSGARREPQRLGVGMLGLVRARSYGVLGCSVWRMRRASTRSGAANREAMGGAGRRLVRRGGEANEWPGRPTSRPQPATLGVALAACTPGVVVRYTPKG